MQHPITDITSQQTLTFISTTITKHNYMKVVLQLSKSQLGRSFDLVSNLRKLCQPKVQFFVLYDSMKKSCCTDIIGAKHVQYDVLFHFGYACFSQKYQPNHYYILPHIQQQQLQHTITHHKTIQQLKSNNISLILCDQSLYTRVIKHKQYLFKEANVQVARLPFDQQQADCYLGFSYYCSNNIANCNILVIKPDADQYKQQSDNPTSQLLLQNIYLCKNSLQINNIYTMTPTQPIQQYTQNSTKRLLQRISQISQLQNHTTFGILVSNPSTKFCQQQIRRVRQVLDGRNLKHFTFMMNNINQCKLGNFPEIQVYIIIACYNYSLYSIKDFYRLVVVPYDIEIAFGQGTYQQYQFDLNVNSSYSSNVTKLQQTKNKQQQKQITQDKQQNQLCKQNNQIALQQKIQTLDFYKSRQYKGLVFSQKKQVQKIKLGKIGIATGYHPINNQSTTTKLQ